MSTSSIKHYSSLHGKNVVMSNVITRSAQGLSLSEKRILFTAIAKMGGKSGDIRITASEYAEAFGISIDTAYRQLKSASDNFFNRYVTLAVPDRKGVLNWKIRWIGAYGYQDQEGYVSLSFTPQILPYLVDLEAQFTKYLLKQACALRSLHSWRLLELFEQMAGKKKDGWLTISIEEFWHSMDASDSYKSNFSLLRNRVIEPSVKELIEKDGWLIEWEGIKKGRKVAMLKFKFEKDPQGRLDV